MDLRPGQVLPGQRVGVLHQAARSGDRAGMDDPPAVLPRPGAHVDHVVGDADRLLVVLDHDDGVPQVAEALEGADEPLVVPLVQPDGGLVEHVEDADQAAADLAGQPDALGLASRQGGRRPGQGQVVEPHVQQELHPLAHFAEDPVGDQVVAVGQVQRGHHLYGLADGEGAEGEDRVPAHGHGQRLGPQTGATTFGAGDLTQVPLQVVTEEVGLRFGVPPLEPRDDAFVLGVEGPLAAVAVPVLEVHLTGAGPEQDQLLLGLLQLLPRGVQREAPQVGHRRHQPREVLAPGARPRGQRPVGQRFRRVRDHQFGVDLELGAEARAGRASPVGGVEREVPRRRVLEAQAVVGAGQVLAEGDGLLLRAVGTHDHHLGHPFGQRQGGLQRLGQPAADVVPPDQPIDHHLDGVLLVPGQVHLVAIGQLDGGAVHPDPGETLFGQVFEQSAVLALAPPHHRGQHQEAGALVEGQDPVDDLLRALSGHRTAALGAVGLADAGVEQPEVVVHLGDGAHRGAWIARCRLLVDGDGGRQTFDEVDVGLVHLTEELAGVGGQRLDVPALALGVDGVEGQGRLAGAGQPGEHDEPVARQVERDVLQVVLARAAYD